MEVIRDFRNDLLKRREVQIVFESNGNPGFEVAKKEILGKFGGKEEGVVVRGVKSKFGRNTFLTGAFIYDSVEDKNRIEPRKKEKKGAKK